jgi:hypothetical protein
MLEKEELKKLSNECLAAQIVVFRLLGLNKDISISCMEELMQREQDGDTFDYNSWIKNELKKSPKPESEDPNKLIKSLQGLIKTKLG